MQQITLKDPSSLPGIQADTFLWMINSAVIEMFMPALCGVMQTFSLFWAVFSGVLVSVLLCLYTFSFHNLLLVLIFVLKTFGCSFCLLNLVSVL